MLKNQTHTKPLPYFVVDVTPSTASDHRQRSSSPLSSALTSDSEDYNVGGSRGAMLRKSRTFTRRTRLGWVCSLLRQNGIRLEYVWDMLKPVFDKGVEYLSWSFLEKQKLTGPNFIDWYRQLRLVLSTEDKQNYLEHHIPAVPVAPPRQQVPPQALAAHAAWVKGQKEELKAMYSKQAEQELLQIVKEFHTSKQEKGQSVSSHVLKMKGYIDNLERLGQIVGKNLAVSLILVSLNKDFDSFVQNYNMHGMWKTMNELHAMLKLHEEMLLKTYANPTLHAIRAGRVQKNQKNKPHKAAHGVMVKVKARWAMLQTMPHLLLNLRLLHHLRKITLQRTPFATNVVKLGIREGTGLRGSKKLKPGALSLYVGDGNCAAVEAIRTYHLELPSGLVIVLNNCHYAPSITRGVISVSRLFDDGFINRFDDNNVISVSKNNLVYFMAVPQDGIFEIDMSCFNTNDSSMYGITNKRAQINLDSSLLWHCRLGNICMKRIKKLQHNGLLNSIDIESLGKCVSCMSGKMERKPYSHQVERAKDLLRLIHTDVFQKEVKNQLGKTIKSLRSDRGGEYTSQEFLDHVKEHEIIAHRTPPYTPQNNGVSERRNRTLLDMEEDTNPSIDTSLNHEEGDQEIDEPHSHINPIRKSSRTHRAPDRICLYIDAEEHELGDLGEPANYKATLQDPESKKWLDAMNVEMQSMKDNDDRLKLKELMELSTKLSDRVLDLENIKTAQAKKIANLKKKFKKLKTKRRSRTPGINLFKIGTSRRRSLSEKDASKHGMNLKQRLIFEESDFDVQAMMDADYELAARLRSEEQRRKPLTKA
nr:hypothetical protein [Tanacetum cinerariifolium]